MEIDNEMPNDDVDASGDNDDKRRGDGRSGGAGGAKNANRDSHGGEEADDEA